MEELKMKPPPPRADLAKIRRKYLSKAKGGAKAKG